MVRKELLGSHDVIMFGWDLADHIDQTLILQSGSKDLEGLLERNVVEEEGFCADFPMTLLFYKLLTCCVYCLKK